MMLRSSKSDVASRSNIRSFIDLDLQFDFKATFDLNDLSVIQKSIVCSISVPNFMSFDPLVVLIYGFTVKFQMAENVDFFR